MQEFGRNFLHRQIQPKPAMSSTPPTTAPPAAITARPGGSVRNLPVNLFGSVMGIAGLGLAWRQANAQYGVPALAGEVIGALAVGVFIVLSLAYAAKLLRHPGTVVAEFRHPVAGNFFGTIVIALLLVSAVLQPYSATLAWVAWTVGAAATFVLAFVIAARLLRGDVDPANALPAWLIPGVATLDIAVTGAQMPMAWAAELNWAAMAVGAVLALVLFTLVFQRLVQRQPLAAGMVPSLMVLVAPFAVGFLAYTGMRGTVDRFASLLFYFGLFLFAVLVPKVFRRGVPFAPGWWAISFPIAALVNAALRYAAAHPSWAMQAIALALLLFLSAALAVLSFRTLRIAFNGELLAG
jgi:tellurite resistance protein